MIEKTSSLVVVDKRHYRKIAQSNWGLTNAQMKGMHVHHRIPISQGGTNDPSNLYVCSPSYHRWVWHKGEEWIEWALKGSQASTKSTQLKRKTDLEWARKERERNRLHAKRSHELHKGTEKYSERQRVKSLKSHVPKRKNWSPEVYDAVWQCYLRGVESGYRIAKQLGADNWKQHSNMLKYASLGFSFEQLLNTEEYLKEIDRIQSSPVANLLLQYDD
jgi:hypothetical protein